MRKSPHGANRDPPAPAPQVDFIDMAGIAERVLAGELLYRAAEYAPAFRALEEAVAAVEWRRRWLAERGAVSDAIGLTLSYVEVFGDEVTDLLKAGRRVGQNKVAAQRYVLEGVCTRERARPGRRAARSIVLALAR